jgi:hypothetical protein
MKAKENSEFKNIRAVIHSVYKLEESLDIHPFKRNASVVKQLKKMA